MQGAKGTPEAVGTTAHARGGQLDRSRPRPGRRQRGGRTKEASRHTSCQRDPFDRTRAAGGDEGCRMPYSLGEHDGSGWRRRRIPRGGGAQGVRGREECGKECGWTPQSPRGCRWPSKEVETTQIQGSHRRNGCQGRMRVGAGGGAGRRDRHGRRPESGEGAGRPPPGAREQRRRLSELGQEGGREDDEAGRAERGAAQGCCRSPYRDKLFNHRRRR